MGILLRDTPAPWPPQLRALREQILAISALDNQTIEGAAIELTVGIEMCREDLLRRNPSAAFDPYQEFLTFAEYPGLDYSDVDGSEIASLTPYQMYMAVAWCYTDTARWFATRPMDNSQSKTDEAIWQASSYEFAARQLIQLACGIRSGPC